MGWCIDDDVVVLLLSGSRFFSGEVSPAPSKSYPVNCCVENCCYMTGVMCDLDGGGGGRRAEVMSWLNV